MEKLRKEVSMADKDGVWRTIQGRKVFIADGQSLNDALKASGKFDKVDLSGKNKSGGTKSDKKGKMNDETDKQEAEKDKTVQEKLSTLKKDRFNKEVEKHYKNEGRFNDYKQTDISEKDSDGGDNSLSKYLDENGNLTPEREALHQKIIDGLFKDKKPVDKSEQEYVIMGGGPASGKSTLLKSGAIGEFPNHAKIDSDYIKSQFPEWNDSKIPVEDRARFVHEESSALAKRAMSLGLENNYSMILDGTGDGSMRSLTNKLNEGRANNVAKITGIYVTVPVDKAVKWSTARAERTGRTVPLEIITGTHRKVSEVMPALSKHFDSVVLYDMENARESGPKLIASGSRGKALFAEKGQETLYEQFLAKGRVGK